MARLLTIKETGRELSVSADTVRRLIETNQIKSVRVARRVMIPTEEMERIAQEGVGDYVGRRRERGGTK